MYTSIHIFNYYYEPSPKEESVSPNNVAVHLQTEILSTTLFEEPLESIFAL